jgi:hypothetical protein
MLVFCIGDAIPIPGQVPPRIYQWQQLLEHLCNGQAYDQVERAIRRQSCTLLYGDVWRVHQAEMRARFPEAVWVRTSTDVGDDGPYMSLDAFSGPIPSLPCPCIKALVKMHCDFMSMFSVGSDCFMQHASDAITSIFVDTHTAIADPKRKEHNYAWIVEPFQYLGAPRLLSGLFRNVYVHGAADAGHVPVSGTWIPRDDYLATHEKIPKAGIILSHKTFMPGHALRHAVVAATATRSDVEASGSGVGRHLACKTPGIAPYMYAIVIENCIEDGYWTEKLVDSLLLKCVVFYWGAPNVHDWFLPQSVIPFSSIDELVMLLDTMSAVDYNDKLPAVELNYHRAQAWTLGDNGILLETNFMSTAEYEITPCSKLCPSSGYVSAKLMGGLGNQLFQMAAAFGAQKLHGQHLQAVVHTPSICPTTRIHSITSYKDTVFAKWPQICENYDESFIERAEDASVYKPMATFCKGKHLHLNGFFQHENYFKHCATEFISKLQLPKDVEHYPGTCFIHVRLGDYLIHHVHNLSLEKKYLPAAIAYVLEKHPDAVFLVFSDDIEKCKFLPELQASNITFNHETDAVRALVAMSNCTLGGICWNSSFSWWGAYLNRNPEKIVTFPKRWMDNDWSIEIQFDGSVVLDT